MIKSVRTICLALGALFLSLSAVFGQGNTPPQILYGQYGNWPAQQNFDTIINPIFYRVNGVPVDRTGTLDTSANWRAALADACSKTPTRGISVPPGIYGFASVVNMPCNDISISATVPGSVTFRILPTNPSAPAIFVASGMDRPRFQGIKFDAAPAGVANGTVTGTTLTLTSSTGTFLPGDRITGDTVLANTAIISQLTGTSGGDGTYQVNLSQTATLATVSVIGRTNSNGAVQINGPSISPEFDNNVFTNMVGNGIWIVPGPLIIAGFLSADVAQGDTTMTLATLDSRVHKGAYFLNEIDPDIYLAAEPSGTTLTLNKAITDSSLKNTRINVTAAFTVTADLLQGDTFLVSHTDGLVPRQTIYSPQAPCVVRGTRIKSIVTNTSVKLERPITCKVASGTSFAAALGISKLRVKDNKFEELGMALAYGAPVIYTTAALTTNGTNTMTLSCVSGIKCAKVGLIPYNTTGLTGLPNGVPPLNPVVDQVSINNNAGTYVVRFANNFTADIPSGTPVQFIGPQNSGKGYALWSGGPAWFSNLDYMFTGNISKHTWSSPYFIWFTSGTTIDGDIFSEDFQEFQSPNIAASACIAGSINVDLTIKNINCRGVTGIGLELNHNIHMLLSNIVTSYNGGPGAYVCGGHDVQVVNYTSYNNGQINNFPKVQQIDPGGYSGLQISGSCTYARTGVLNNLLLSNLDIFDDQVSINGTPTPTQNYGIWQWNHNAVLNNVVLGQYVVTGNKIAQFDPNLGFNPPPLGQDNRIINPCTTIDQRNQGAVLTISTGYSSDRWQVLSTPTRISYQRTATVMGGCPNSLKMTVVTQATPVVTSFSYAQQLIEASFVGDLKFGTTSARNIIVDFCASATTAGTYGWGLQNHFGGHLRAYASSFTIAAPNTPQCYSKVVAGDQVAGFSGVPGAAGLGIGFDSGSGLNFYTPTCDQWADIASNTGFFCNTATALVTLAAGQSINFSAVRIYPADSDQLPWLQKAPEAEQASAYRYFVPTFVGVVPAQNAGLIGALCAQNPTDQALQNYQWNFPVPMRIAPTITTFNPSAANALGRDVTAGVDVVVTANPDGSEDPLQVLLQFAATPLNDLSCVQATANAEY